MEKRYQVFVSSTYADLKQERQHVIQALMEMDCIPAGMELFPAADEEQWEFIKRVIDDCDYYLLIIGGRYGSTTPEGVSYTEKEYDYAIEKGLKVIALIHEKPEEIPVGKSDIEPELRMRLSAFREKVSSNRLVKFWSKAEELPGLVALSLSKTIKMFPAVGWVRANIVGNERGGPGNSDSVISGSLASLKPRDGGEPEEHGDEENETKSRGGIQGQGGIGYPEGRQDPGGVGGALWRASHPDHGMEAATAGASIRRIWRHEAQAGGA
jgi:hypothetical protein